MNTLSVNTCDIEISFSVYNDSKSRNLNAKDVLKMLRDAFHENGITDIKTYVGYDKNGGILYKVGLTPNKENLSDLSNIGAVISDLTEFGYSYGYDDKPENYWRLKADLRVHVE